MSAINRIRRRAKRFFFTFIDLIAIQFVPNETPIYLLNGLFLGLLLLAQAALAAGSSYKNPRFGVSVE